MVSISTSCVIVGGGPAGMMCGFLLARAGIDVTVLEKHADFLRDFRGDTVHPSTLQVMHELGLLKRFLELPHTPIRLANVWFGERRFQVGDFSRLPTKCRYIAMMPQWDFLEFLRGEAQTLPNFHLRMETKAEGLILDGDRIAGISATGKDGKLEIRAGLTIAADGRHSTLRAQSGLKVRDLGAPFDVLWFRLPAREGDPVDLNGRIGPGKMFVMIYRTDYWQCAYLIPKGGLDAIRAAGIEKFRADVREVAGFAADRVDQAMADFDHIKLLTVTVDRLEEWARPGLQCIGDAAHAMSPIGGVGINLAIQDAVAAANILAPVLQYRSPTLDELRRVQKRREFSTKVIQTVQVIVQNRVLAPTLRSERAPDPPLGVKLLNAWPWARQFPARFIGLGPRPEHVKTSRKTD